LGHEPYAQLNIQNEIKQIVFERDNYTCQICGKTKEELGNVHLCCHHIDPIKNNPVESADVDNCISVCRTCHNMIHSNNCNYGFLSTCKEQ
jgi:5-methylcytosine-specific restriction endonuclease McrA